MPLPTDGPYGSVLTCDTILVRGTTIITHLDGTLDDYLRAFCDAYLAHRHPGPGT
ncbi:hypothetical protein [Cryobacterium sp. M23]|uniref:hypothetical protein n=1 Tax=Cryobacterium sp. M23 TaxID=2048292 RepID=UPI0018EC076F|nr:hypothetical protein [Cryobacterium sp. M23]